MKNLLAFVAAAVMMFAGVGWYLDWFQVLGSTGASGHYSVNVDIDGTKIKEDVQKGEAKVADAIDKARKDAAAKAEAEKTDPTKNTWSEPIKPVAVPGGK
jgi:hypothetical protein